MGFEPQPEVFTRAFKVKGSIVHGVVGLLLFIVPLFGGLGGALLIGRRWGDAAGLMAMVGALLLTAAGIYLGHQKVLLIYNSGLRRDLAAALARRLGRNPDDGRAYFVGWAPGLGFNPKDGDTDHDVGFLTLAPEAMTFFGDTTAFQLHRGQVYTVECKQAGIPIIMDMGFRIGVYWLDAYGQQQAFTLERREGRNRSEVRRNTKQLAELLQQWRDYGFVPQ